MKSSSRVHGVRWACLAAFLLSAVTAAHASDVSQRIEALEQELSRLGAVEQELARLKAEQEKTREQAVAAEMKMPIFLYRPGNGLTIAAPDNKWEVQFGNRLMVYWTFWTKGSDGTSRPKQGTTNGVLQVRRFRPYMNTRINDGFYDLRFQMDASNGGGSGGGDLFAFDAEMYLHFENISPWLPYFAFGASPSAILNPQDTNCSSKRCGRSERSLLNEGAGVTTSSPDRGMGFVWREIPRFGPVRISFLNAFLGEDRIGGSAQFNNLAASQITRDGRSFTAGIGVRPFDKLGGSFGNVMKGLELSFGTLIQNSPRADSGFGAWNVRTNQTRAQRISMIRTDSAGTAGTFYYYTPGVGWNWKWMRLRFAGQFANARLCSEDNNSRCMDGPLVRGSGWRFMGEFWLWSPKKGLLAGNARDGGFMIAPMFSRADVKQSGNATLRGCGGCKSAHAIDAGIGLWYYIPGRFMNVGVVWDHWKCNNCNSDVQRTVPGFVAGNDAEWDTITFVSRFQF